MRKQVVLIVCGLHEIFSLGEYHIPARNQDLKIEKNVHAGG